MKCEICQKEDATVRLTKIIAGKLQQIELCDKCSQDTSAADPSTFSDDYITGQDR